jgi:hypothetical protein
MGEMTKTITADDIYKKYFLTSLKRKVFDEVYEAIQNNQSVDTKSLVEQSIQKHSTQSNHSSVNTGYGLNRVFITASMLKKATFEDTQAGQDLNRIVSEKVDSYNKQLLNNDISNTLDTLMCLIEVEDICIKTSRSSIKDIINTRYSDLDETDQFTVTLATGYQI